MARIKTPWQGVKKLRLMRDWLDDIQMNWWNEFDDKGWAEINRMYSKLVKIRRIVRIPCLVKYCKKRKERSE